MKAIITGATGFLGRHLVEELSQKGWEIIALGRNTTKGKALEKENVCFRPVDLCDLKQLQSVIEEADIIFHCAALSSPWGKYNDFYNNNVLATKNLITILQERNIKRFVHVSSPSIYFQYQNRLNYSEETDMPRFFVNHYAKTKWMAEEILLSNTNETMETVIIRPRGIFGEYDETIMPRILKIANKGRFPLINHGRSITDITYVKNVTHALYLAATIPNINKQIYNITNDEPLPLYYILENTFHMLNINVRYIHLPKWLVNAYAALVEKVAYITGKREPTLTRYSMNLFCYSQSLNIHKARQELGYKPIYSIQEGIKNYVQWHQENSST